MKRPMQTPWGTAQLEHEHAPGIVFYSTASHGGYHLSTERYAEFCEIPHFSHWSQWLEEDCEACLVYLRWPELATNEQIHGAVLTARTVASWATNGRWETIVAWLDQTDQPLQQTILIRAQQHANDTKHLWKRGSMGSTNRHGIWWVSFYRGDEKREVRMEYPTKRYYTDDELTQLDRTIIKPSESNSIAAMTGRSGFPSHCFVGNGDDFSPSDADPGL